MGTRPRCSACGIAVPGRGGRCPSCGHHDGGVVVVELGASSPRVRPAVSGRLRFRPNALGVVLAFALGSALGSVVTLTAIETTPVAATETTRHTASPPTTTTDPDAPGDRWLACGRLAASDTIDHCVEQGWAIDPGANENHGTTAGSRAGGICAQPPPFTRWRSPLCGQEPTRPLLDEADEPGHGDSFGSGSHRADPPSASPRRQHDLRRDAPVAVVGRRDALLRPRRRRAGDGVPEHAPVHRRRHGRLGHLRLDARLTAVRARGISRCPPPADALSGS
jgi:hypothetical protein